MGFFSPDPPKQAPIGPPPEPLYSHVQQADPATAAWFAADQAVHGIAQANAEALRMRNRIQGPKSPPPGGYSGR